MAKRVFSLVERIALLSTQQGGYASRQDIATQLGIASQQAWNALLPAKVPRATGPGLNRALDDRLRPFLRELEYQSSAPAPLDITNGRFSLPEPGYVSFYQVDGAVAVEEVGGAAWQQRLADPNCGPTAQAPLVRDVQGASPATPTKEIVPAPGRLVLNVYVQPTEPVYTQAYVNNVAVYDDVNSVDMGWGTDMEPELIVRTLRLLGLEIRDPALMQVAQQLTTESQ